MWRLKLRREMVINWKNVRVGESSRGNFLIAISILKWQTEFLSLILLSHFSREVRIKTKNIRRKKLIEMSIKFFLLFNDMFKMISKLIYFSDALRMHCDIFVPDSLIIHFNNPKKIKENQALIVTHRKVSHLRHNTKIWHENN